MEFIGNEKLALAVVSRTTHEEMQRLCPRDRLLSVEEILRWATAEARSENPEQRERWLDFYHGQSGRKVPHFEPTGGNLVKAFAQTWSGRSP